MLLIWLMLLWIFFGVITAAALLYLRYCYHQILGVTFSRAHAKHQDVVNTVQSFAKVCIGILILSIILSTVTLIPFLRAYTEFLMLLLMALNLFCHYVMVVYYQKRLTDIKTQNHWVYPRISREDTTLTFKAEKGTKDISPVWVWLFFGISFVPSVILLFRPNLQDIYPIGISLMGAVCQLIMIFPYYQTSHRYYKPAIANEEENLWFLQQENKIQKQTSTYWALAMLIFWLLFDYVLVKEQSSPIILIPVILLIISLLFIEYWHQNNVIKLETELFQQISEEEDNVREHDGYFKWGFYNNPEDSRFLVPKKSPGMGWTINMGHPAGKLTMAGTLIFTLAILGLVIYCGQKDYNISIHDSTLVIDAAMYDREVAKDEIISVSLITQLPDSRRTNGYGGFRKSFGHFLVDGYGKSMVFIYNNVNEYVIVKLKGSNPGFIIVNEKTTEKTSALYQTVINWLQE